MIRFTDKRDTSLRTRSPVATHKFAIGASVSSRVMGQPDLTRFKVTKQMPEQSGAFQYRIKSDADGKERVVPEMDLIATS